MDCGCRLIQEVYDAQLQKNKLINKPKSVRFERKQDKADFFKAFDLKLTFIGLHVFVDKESRSILLGLVLVD